MLRTIQRKVPTRRGWLALASSSWAHAVSPQKTRQIVRHLPSPCVRSTPKTPRLSVRMTYMNSRERQPGSSSVRWLLIKWDHMYVYCKRYFETSWWARQLEQLGLMLVHLPRIYSSVVPTDLMVQCRKHSHSKGTLPFPSLKVYIEFHLQASRKLVG